MFQRCFNSVGNLVSTFLNARSDKEMDEIASSYRTSKRSNKNRRDKWFQPEIPLCCLEEMFFFRPVQQVCGFTAVASSEDKIGLPRLFFSVVHRLRYAFQNLINYY